MGVKRSRGNLRKSARDPELTLGGIGVRRQSSVVRAPLRAGAKVKNGGLTPNFKHFLKKKAARSEQPFIMRRRGLEPPCLSALAPQASVSTNSTIAAR